MQLELFNAKFLEILDEMEIETGKSIVEMVLAGLKPTGLQQVTALIPFCREQILMASIVMERGVDDLNPGFLVGVPTKDGIVTLVGTMAQLSQTLQTLTSSILSIASRAKKIIEKGHEYEKVVFELASSLQEKKKHHLEVERLGQSLSLSVSKLDGRMAANLDKAAERTATVMARSTRAIYLIAIVVLLVSCIGTTLVVLLGRKMNRSIAEKEVARTELSEKMVLLEKEVERRQKAEREANQLAENLEKSVEERTVALHSLNMELESIVYSMSHDLRTPLRGIAGFSNAMLADCGANLDASGRHYLARIQDATITMGRTIDQILELSRFSRETMLKEKLEMSVLVEAIILEFQRNDPGRSVQVEITPNLYAFGAEDQIRAVLESLLANAWKFTGLREQAKIKFGCCRINDKPVFYVKDNGVGFNQKYSAKMFGAFQRLHLADDFPGAGIGLALVQRVVQRHGGKVWGEGKEGEGATFYFQI